MANQDDLFAPPAQEELDMFVAPTESEQSDIFAPPSQAELEQDGGMSLPPEAKGAVGLAAGGAGGYATGKLIDKGAKAATKIGYETVLPKLGELKSSEIQHISADTDKYRKISPLEQLLEQYKTMGEDTKEKGYSFAAKAKASLPDTSIPTKDYYKILGEAAGDKKYSAPASQSQSMQIINKNAPSTDALKAKAAQVEASILDAQSKLTELEKNGLKGSDAYVQFQQQLDSGLAQKQALFDQGNKDLAKSLEKSQKEIKKNITRIPDEILEAKPNLAGKSFDPELSRALDKAVGKGRGTDQIPVKRLAEGVLPALRDKAEFGPAPTFADTFNTDMSEKLRADLGERFPTYDENMKASSKAINLEDDFKKLGMKIDTNTGAVELPASAKAKINKIILDPETNSDEFARLKRIYQTYPEIGDQLPASVTANFADEALDNLKTSAIKNKVTKSLDDAEILGGNIKQTGRNLFSTLGTKAQEQAALLKGSGLARTASKISSALPSILGVGGAILGATGAANAGELAPEEAMVAGAAEAINPIPGTDAIAAAVEGKKAANQAIKENSPYLETMDDPTSLTGVRQGNAVLDNTLAGAARGFVSPLPDLAQTATQAMDNFGKSQSTDARSRMEQNMNALTGLKKSKEPEKADFNEFKEISNEDLNNLAQMFSTNESKAAQLYSGPLSKAANATEGRTRDAILWGLHQQPAFRQTYKQLKKPM